MFLKKNRGFSLLELLIIVLIISILIAVAIPSFFDFQLRSKRAKAREDIDVFINAISLFELEESKSLWDYARETQVANPGSVTDTDILGMLVGPYLKKLAADPWGNQYVCDMEVGYILSRGANGVEDANDILADQDIKVFYGAPDLAIKDAIYVDIANDGITAGDKVYIYFTQTICVTGLDLAGNAPNDQENAVDSDPAAPTAPAGLADAAWFTTRDSAGLNPQVLVAADVTAVDEYLEAGSPISVDTRTIVLTLAANGVINPTVENNLKNTGYINLTVAGAAALIGCDLDAAGADVPAVAHSGAGLRVRKE